MNQKGRVIFFAVTVLQLLVAGVSSEETKACDELNRLACNEIRSEHVQRCVEENPQIDDVVVQYVGVESIQKAIDDGPDPLPTFDDAQPRQDSLSNFGGSLANNAVCKWSYRNESDPLRIPSSISHATCLDEETTYTTIGGAQYQCRPIWYPMNVLKLSCTEGGKKWNFTYEVVSFGCSLNLLSEHGSQD